MKGLLAALLTAGALVLVVGAGTASAAPTTVNGTVHCDPSDPTCPINPLLTGPAGVPLPAGCPAFLSTDAWSLDLVSGNTTFHGTENKNGDWGGETGEGQAQLTSSDGTVQYAGHATIWGGGGNNSGGQTEGGFTLTFHGTGTAGTIDIHVDQHGTTNNAGTPTGNVFNVTVTCS
jgi:hypothetical protein